MTDPGAPPGVDALSRVIWDVAQSVVSPEERTYWGYLLPAVVLWVLVLGRRASVRSALREVFSARLWLHPSALLDYQLVLTKSVLQVLLFAPIALSTLSVMAVTAAVLQFVVGPVEPWSVNRWVIAAAYSVTLFVFDDASRYVLHRVLHRVPFLWQLHQVHHSAEVLTPFTLLRAHPVESLMFAYRGALVTGAVTGVFFFVFRGALNGLDVLGINVFGFGFNALGANLRHSPVWISYGKVERWLISPAQHQLHHSVAPEHYDRNFGSFLSVWDRLGGTLLFSPAVAELRFGLDADTQNHASRLDSVLVGPLLAAFGRRRARA